MSSEVMADPANRAQVRAAAAIVHVRGRLDLADTLPAPDRPHTDEHDQEDTDA